VTAELRAEAFWIESTEPLIMKPRAEPHWFRSIKTSHMRAKVSNELLKPTPQNTTSRVTSGYSNRAGCSSRFLVKK